MHPWGIEKGKRLTSHDQRKESVRTNSLKSRICKSEARIRKPGQNFEESYNRYPNREPEKGGEKLARLTGGLWGTSGGGGIWCNN